MFRVTDPLGHTTTSSYDSMNRLIKVTEKSKVSGTNAPKISP